MKKCILLVGLLIVAGCASQVAKWTDAGTLVSVSPAQESTRTPGMAEKPLAESQMGLTRVETTKNVYIVHGKVSVANTGMPVKLGYAKKAWSDEIQNTPSYLSFGGQKYSIAR